MKLNYCPECAAPLIKKSDSAYICKNNHPYWNNARMAVAVALVRDGHVLFAKRGREPNKGLYDLPGGFADYGENAEQAARRELEEEAGIKIIDPVIVASFANMEYEENVSICDIVFVVTKWEGEPTANDDVATLEWKPIDFINSDQFAPPQWNGFAEKLYTLFNIPH